MFSDIPPIAVYAAARRLRGVARRTELRRSARLGALARGEVFLKLECEQVTGSFKIRGAFNAIASLPEDVRARGVVASSAGNHGQGVAFAAKHFGIPATIFVPSTAPKVKRRGMESHGATVHADAPHYDAAHAQAKAYAAEHGMTFIDPCAGETVLAGQGTAALEIIEELPELATLITPVGGGGLVGGAAVLLRCIAPHVRIAGAQSEKTAAMALSLAASRLVSIPNEPTLADGLAGDIDEYALDVGRRALDDIVTVSEEEIARAIRWLWHEEQLTVEGAGAVGVAALLTRKLTNLRSPIAVIVSGKNIDQEVLERVLGDGE
jgi:threonine dehydratase